MNRDLIKEEMRRREPNEALFFCIGCGQDRTVQRAGFRQLYIKNKNAERKLYISVKEMKTDEKNFKMESGKQTESCVKNDQTARVFLWEYPENQTEILFVVRID